MDSGIDLRLQLYAVIVAEELNFSAAANRLHVAQPALSRAVRQLEDYLGIMLFRRTSRKVELTEAGQEFIYEARKAVHYASRAVERTRKWKTKTTERLVIGYPPQFSTGFLVELRKLRLPGIARLRITLQSSFTAEIVSSLQAGEFDAGIIAMPDRYPELAEWKKFTLSRHPVNAAMMKTHPLAKKQILELTDIEHQQLIFAAKQQNPALYEWFEKQCQAAGFPPNIVQEVRDPMEYGAMIYHGGGSIAVGVALSTTCPVTRLPDDIVVRPFRETNLAIETAMIFGDKFAVGPLKAFVPAAQKCWHDAKPTNSMSRPTKS